MGQTLLTNARIVDVVGGRVLDENELVVSDGRIVALRTATEADGTTGGDTSGANGDVDSSTATDTVIDLQGRYLLPGLISVHTHLSVVYPFSATDADEHPAVTTIRSLRRAEDALQAGVTTIRSVHEQHQADLVLRGLADTGMVRIPRIRGAGRALSTTGGHGHGMACVYADGHDEFLRAARSELADGADHVKVFITGGLANAGEVMDGSQMTMDEMKAVVRAARDHGAYVVAHAGEASAINEGLDAGIRSFEHAYILDDDTAARLAAADVFLTPTLCVTRCPEWMADHSFTADQVERAIGFGPTHLASIRRAVDAGVTIVAGTDYPPGEPIEDTVVAVREMEFLAEAGLDPMLALQAGTSTAARLLGLHDDIGAIDVGKVADLIAVPSDPLSDVKALRDIDFVMQSGEVVRPVDHPAGHAA